MPAFNPTCLINFPFAFGIDPVGGGLPTDTPQDWPGRAQVAAYCQRLRDTLDERLAASLDPFAELPADLAQLLHVAIEHRLMHAETLAYMLHQLPTDRKLPRANSLEPPASPVTPRMVRIPPGTATLGLPRAEAGAFGWDNEFEEHSVNVPDFRIDAHKVTNRQFLHFVVAGGYQTRALWDDAGWNWLQSSGVSHPSFWSAAAGRPLLRTMFGEIPLPMDWPVYVSQAEAAAYAK